MGKFNAALLWLGAPLALEYAGLLPVWGAIAWLLAPFIALAVLGLGAGAVASVMDACTGDRAVRSQGAGKAKASRTAVMPPSAWTIHHPGSP
ncbi:hypothetical protein SAE02_57350 [Skermanella aerolata]|uniref:Uncharacterized protein n=1 Tax=Skermanella aerolata TaxID=393310 RepID=A0A512DYL3_9PROT|nr:hypothetical protein [Skermanella aerolata]KJB93077.1 hypothetical protein N826_18705 [Skermanella aerolata KACC 11604]GEO41587.1 hypothetical protein SAE02_57350 [Skermanella aerolata]